MITNVNFVIEGKSYEVKARVPQNNTIPDEGIRVMTINNAIEDVKKQYGVNPRRLFADVYKEAILR